MSTLTARTAASAALGISSPTSSSHCPHYHYTSRPPCTGPPTISPPSSCPLCSNPPLIMKHVGLAIVRQPQAHRPRTGSSYYCCPAATAAPPAGVAAAPTVWHPAHPTDTGSTCRWWTIAKRRRRHRYLISNSLSVAINRPRMR